MSTCKKLQPTIDTSRYDVVIIADKKKPDAEEKKLARTKKLGNVEWLKQCLVSCILRLTARHRLTLPPPADYRGVPSTSIVQEALMTNDVKA